MDEPLPSRHPLVRGLRQARKAHRRWVSNAQSLVGGIPRRNEDLPLEETHCEFGRWYYGEGQALKEHAAFRELEKPHRRLHGLYLDIQHLLFRKRKASLLERIRGRRPHPTPEELDQARQLFAELNRESERMLELLEVLEQTLSQEPGKRPG